MNISENIRKYRKAKGYTQGELAKLLNVKTSAVSAWEIGRNQPLMDNVEKLANILGVKKSNLIGDSLPDNVIPIDTVIKVPIIGTIACGTPILAEQNISGYQCLPANLIPEDGHVFFLKCKGDSMAPTIKDGSLVLIHEQPYVEDNEVAAVEINEKATLKRVKHLDGQILLMPDNKDYSPIILKKHDDNRILGKAIQVINSL